MPHQHTLWDWPRLGYSSVMLCAQPPYRPQLYSAGWLIDQQHIYGGNVCTAVYVITKRLQCVARKVPHTSCSTNL